MVSESNPNVFQMSQTMLLIILTTIRKAISNCFTLLCVKDNDIMKSSGRVQHLVKQKRTNCQLHSGI